MKNVVWICESVFTGTAGTIHVGSIALPGLEDRQPPLVILREF